jgi:adenylyltransferase/sulfurtransferase
LADARDEHVLLKSPDLARYDRQTKFSPLGTAGQQRLSESRALICGCGALGTVLANTLARAGIGHLRIVDRDFIELSNLQRQVLFDEPDVASGLPKAVAAANKLRLINSTIEIEPIVADVDSTNIDQLLKGTDIILDGTDNFETRFLLNDASIHYGIPWVYGGCLGSEGQTMTILPGETPCLRCLIRDPPPPGSTPTCDTAGILAPIISVIASIEATEAIKILSGNLGSVNRTLCVIDVWDNRLKQISLQGLKESGGCDTCSRIDFPWLDGKRGSQTAILCGRNAVQLNFPDRTEVSLESLAKKLESSGRVILNPFLLRLFVDDFTITIFRDGRAIVSGTQDVSVAKSVHAKYVGA